MSITDYESLKRQGTSVKGRFTRTINHLKRTLDDEHYCIDIINSMFNDVNDSWKNVNEKHDNYITLSETNDFTEADGLLKYRNVFMMFRIWLIKQRLMIRVNAMW